MTRRELLGKRWGEGDLASGTQGINAGCPYTSPWLPHRASHYAKGYPVARGTRNETTLKRLRVAGGVVRPWFPFGYQYNGPTQSGVLSRGFVRDPNGVIAIFDAPGAISTEPLGINDSGAIMGTYLDSGFGGHGFLRDPGGVITTFDLGGLGFNNSGVIVGSYWTPIPGGSISHGFVRDPGGLITTVDVAGSDYTTLVSVNDSGAAAGLWMLSRIGVLRGFVRDPAGAITTFDVPGSSGMTPVTPITINAAGAIIGTYYDANSNYHGYLRDPGGNITTIDAPDAIYGTFPYSINAAGVITGSYVDANSIIHGFVFTAQTALYKITLLYDSTKTVHSGATLPVKLVLTDSSGKNVSSPAVSLHAISITQVSTSISSAVQSSGNANPNNDFRLSGGSYLFDLKTTGLAAGAYVLNFTATGDSTVYSAPFQIQ